VRIVKLQEIMEKLVNNKSAKDLKTTTKNSSKSTKKSKHKKFLKSDTSKPLKTPKNSIVFGLPSFTTDVFIRSG